MSKGGRENVTNEVNVTNVTHEKKCKNIEYLCMTNWNIFRPEGIKDIELGQKRDFVRDKSG